MNEYDQILSKMALERDDEPVGYDEVFRVLQEEQAARASQAMIASRWWEPAKAALSIESGMALGLHPSTVREHLEEAQARIKKEEAERALAVSPRLRAWLDKPENAAVIERMRPLSQLERYLGNPVAAWGRGAASMKLARLLEPYMNAGVDPDTAPGVEELRRKSQVDLRSDKKAWTADLIEGTAGVLPFIFDVWGESTQGALFGATAGGTIAYGLNALFPVLMAVPEETITVPTGISAGAKIGGIVGAVYGSHRMEGALLYDEAVQELKREGLPINYRQVAAIASIAGAINAGAEFASLGVWTKYAAKLIPDTVLKRLGLSPLSAKALLRQPSIRRSLLGAAEAGGVSLATETATEGVQRAVSVAGLELAKGLEGGEMDLSRIPEEAAQEMAGAAVSFLGLSLFPGIGEFHYQAAKGIEAEERAARVKNVARLMNLSGMAERSPHKAEEAMKHLLEGTGEPERAYIPSRAFVALFQEEKVAAEEGAELQEERPIEPAALHEAKEAAEKILGPGGAERLVHALSVDGDLVVPMETYLGKIAPSEMGPRIIEDTRFGDEGISLKEAAQWAKDAPEQIKQIQAMAEAAAAEVAPKPGDKTFEYVEQQLAATGRYTPYTARVQALLYRSFFVRAAERWNRNKPEGERVDPDKLFEEYAPKIVASEARTKAKIEAEVAGGAPPRPGMHPLPVMQGAFHQELTAEQMGDRIAEALTSGPAPMDETARSPILYQVQNLDEWKDHTAAWMEENGYTKTQIKKHLAAMEAQLTIFRALGPTELELLPRGAGKNIAPRRGMWTGVGGPIRFNQDTLVYKITFDASSMCARRNEASATAAYIQQKIGRALTLDERLALMALFRAAGKKAPCLYCYVENPRSKQSEAVDRAMKFALGEIEAPKGWKAPTLELAEKAREDVKRLELEAEDIDVNSILDPHFTDTPSAQAARAEAPALYKFLRASILAANANLPKLYEEYTGQILDLPQELIEELNGYAGLRFFSSSDFQAEHVADLVQAVFDMALKGAKAHAYVKVKEFAEIFGATGMKIQCSLFAERRGDKISQDTWQGMDWEVAKELRSRFPDVGTVLVAADDEIVAWALEQPWIDYIIPFHRSGLEKEYYDVLGWQDFTSTQREKSMDGAAFKNIRMHDIIAGRGMTDEAATRSYLKLAMERRIYPPFPAFLFKDFVPGQLDRPEAAKAARDRWRKMVAAKKIAWSEINPNYFKLRKDYARSDTPFRVVKPEIDFAKADEFLQSFFEAGGKPATADTVIGDGLIDMIRGSEGTERKIGLEALKEIRAGREDLLRIEPKPEGPLKVVQKGEPLFQEDEGKGKVVRGYTARRPGGGLQIGLLRKANLSTFLHETGHFFLEVYGDLASRPDAPSDMVDDYAALLRFLGVESREQIEKVHHEKFAEAWIEWLREGTAPSKELAGAFQLFKAWLTGLYKILMGGELNDEVRGVFSRMLAAEDEIERVQKGMGYEAIAETREEVGASQDEWDQYQRRVAEAREEGLREVQSRLLAEQRRTVADWYKQEKERVKGEVEAEYDRSAAWKARRYLLLGEVPEGLEIPDALRGPDGQVLRLDEKTIKRLYGVTKEGRRIVRKLAGMLDSDGIDPSVLAPVLGFQNDAELVEALIRTNDRERDVAIETAKRMREAYPDLLERGKLPEAAQAAAHKSRARRAQFLMEIRMLARKANVRTGRALKLDEMERAAREYIGQRRYRDLAAHLHRRAEEKAGKAALDAAAKGDYRAALEAKVAQMRSHVLYAATVQAKEKAEKTVRNLRRVTSDKARADIGKAGGDYLTQFDALMDRFEFKVVPYQRLEARQSLAEWVEERRAEGQEPLVDPYFLDESRRMNWRELTIDELEGLWETAQSIRTLAKSAREIRLGEKQVSFEEAKGRALGTIRKNFPGEMEKRLQPKRELGVKGAVRKAADVAAMLLRPETIATKLDAGEANGTFHQLVIQPVKAAQHAEDKMLVEYVEKLIAAFRELTPEHRKSMHEDVYLKRMGLKVTREELLAIALNIGSDSNFDKMLRSAHPGAVVWDELAIEEALDQLTREDWVFVQKIWDTLESLWPKVADMESRLTGLAPEKVAPRSFERTLSDGTTIHLNGGYYPLNYVHRAQMSSEEIQAQLYEHGYASALTPNGHIAKRVQKYTAPLNYRLDVITRHVSQVIHDLTHRETLIGVWRLLSDREVMTALEFALGPSEARQFLPWLRYIANQRNDYDAVTAASSMLRRNIGVSAMGLKATTTLQNVANFTNAAEVIGITWFMRGVGATFTTGGGINHAIRAVHELSGEMANRWNSFDRSVREVHDKYITGKGELRELVQKHAYSGIAFTDAMVAIPTWLGAYAKAQEKEGLEGREAVEYADKAVRDALGAGSAADLPAIMREKEALKWLTMFYSFWNTVYQRHYLTVEKARRKRREGGFISKELLVHLPWILARFLFYMGAMQILSELLSGRGPDDDEDWPEWMTRKVLITPALTVPFIREIASYADTGMEPKIGPLSRLSDELVRTGRTTSRYLEGDAEFKELAKRYVSLSGYLGGIPSGQAVITIGNAWDMIDGSDEPEDFVDGAMDLLYRKERKR